MTRTAVAPLTRKFKAFFFDLDGTLIDSAPDILNLIRKVLTEEGLPTSTVGFHCIGPHMEDVFAGVAPGKSPEEQHRLLGLYRAFYRESEYPGSHAYEGIADVLKALASAGRPAFVATNKPLDVTRRILGFKGLLPLFKDVACSDSVPGKRISKAGMLTLLMERNGVKASESLMVGDSRLDMQGGKEAGMATMAALYGYGKREVLLETGPDFVADDAGWKSVRGWPSGNEVAE